MSPTLGAVNLISRSDLLLPVQSDPAVRSCYVSKVCHYWVGRNAWHSTWSEHYSMKGGFSFDMDHLIEKIERSRVQGSRFNLIELPALVLVANDAGAVVVVDVRNVQAPFFRPPPRMPPPLSLYAAAKWATSHSEQTACWRVQTPPVPAIPPFNWYVSRSVGSALPLQWLDNDREVKHSHAYKLAASLSRNGG